MAKLLRFTDSKVQISECFEAGNQVIVIGRSVGEIRSHQMNFDVRVVHVWTLTAGKIIRFEPYIDTPSMLKALSGDSLDL